jgi:hypothetical protein
MIAHVRREGFSGSLDFELPKRRPQVGDHYEFAQVCNTVGGQFYQVGDTLEIIEMTFEAPHGYSCSAGNWRAKTKYGVSVWSCLELSISQNLLQLVQPPAVPRRSIWERLDD